MSLIIKWRTSKHSDNSLPVRIIQATPVHIANHPRFVIMQVTLDECPRKYPCPFDYLGENPAIETCNSYIQNLYVHLCKLYIHTIKKCTRNSDNDIPYTYLWTVLPQWLVMAGYMRVNHLRSHESDVLFIGITREGRMWSDHEWRLKP